MLVSATNAEKSIKLLIEHQCPQCGAPATLTETDRLVQCEFCKVTSYLTSRGCFRYMLPCSAPAQQHLIYFPFWRFKGMLFSCVPNELRHRFIDVSHRAVDSKIFPVSVGLRSQALKLRFVLPESQGHFLRPTLSLEAALSTFERRFQRDLPQPVFYQCHIGENLSLIYAPFYLDHKLYDAVLNKPLSGKPPEGFNPLDWPGGAPGRQIEFKSALCPHCGWDLKGQREAAVLHCRNCDSAWQPDAKAFRQVPFGHIPAGGEETVYLPFWRIRAAVGGIAIESYADLVRLANLPKAVQPGWEDIGFRFWTMAFKVRPRSFIGLASKMTLAQPREEPQRTLPSAGRLFPVTLGVDEAVESLKANLASYAKPRRQLFPRLAEITVRPLSALLVYVPFREKSHEYVQPDYHIVVNKQQLALAKHL
jgi:hypothetical protein